MFQSVSWAVGDEITSAKLQQMVENLRTHDHRFNDTQGTPIARVLSGTVTITPVANTATYATITYPIDFFDPAGPTPRVVANPGSTNIGSTVPEPAFIRNAGMDSVEVGVFRTNTTAMTVTYLVVQAPA